MNIEEWNKLPAEERKKAFEQLSAEDRRTLTRRGLFRLGVGVAIFLIAVTAIKLTGKPRSPKEVQARIERPNKGEIAVIWEPLHGQIFAGFSQATIDEITQRSTANDVVGIQQLIRARKAGLLNHGQKVLVIKTGIFTTRVRPTEMPNKDIECFVSSDFVRKSEPDLDAK